MLELYRRYGGMKGIDWYHEKITGKIKFFENGNGGYRNWEDLITGTNYCISESDYQRIYMAGKEKLQKLQQENKLEEMEQLFYPTGGITDTELFACLPYFTEYTKKCVRICDHIRFRTACLYVIKYESIKSSIDPENEKKKLRMQGFVCGIIDGSKNIPELEHIDAALMGESGNTGMDLLNHKADFIKGGIVKIKQYYLETNKIPEIRGASLLLDNINTRKMEEIISRQHIRECLVYAGGGKMMAIVPETTGLDICLHLERLVEIETVTAQSNFYSRPYGLKRLISDYKTITGEMDLALEECQGLRWDFRIEPKLEKEVPQRVLSSGGYSWLKEADQVFCTSCRNRHAVAEYKKLGEKLCPSCLCKRMEGGRSAKHSMHKKYCQYVWEKYQRDISADLNDFSYNKLEDIAEDNFIGIIYGDANNMSHQIKKLDSIPMMRYFSEVMSRTVTDIVFDALFQHLKDKLSFEVIAIGGDDIFLIVPGKYAYDIACTIGELFDRQFENKSDGKKMMTISMGVCITHTNMPVQYSFEIAQQLLRSAKQKAWEEQKTENVTGTIDYMVIENDTAGNADLRYQRRYPMDKPAKTLRPYTWKQAKAMKCFLYEIKDERSFAFELRQSWYQHTKEEAQLFYEYQINRKNETNVPHALREFAKFLGGSADKNNIVCNGTAYSPWTDAVELWDYVEGME